MAGVIGPRAAVDLSLPSGVDGNVILQHQMADNRSVGQLIAELASALGAVNEELFSKFSGLVHLTDSPVAFYSAGVGGSLQETPKRAEFSDANAVRGADAGHMLPLENFQDALAWSWLYLRGKRASQVSADIRVIVERWRGRVIGDVFRRIFTDTELAIGTGYSVPWAKTAASGNVDYIPPGYGQYEFDGTHTHFLANANSASSDFDTAIEAAILHLRHHGITGQLSLMCSDADIAKFAGITGKFVKIVPSGVQTVGGSSSAPVHVTTGEMQGMLGERFGLYLSDRGPTVNLYGDERVPAGYFALYKSYGANNPNNPLAIRVYPETGFGLTMDPKGNASLTNPTLEKVLVNGTHGVGVNRRDACVVTRMGNGTWANPTI
jgi:hypothetical protein